MCGAVYPYDFYSCSRWMEEKVQHIIYQNNVIKVIYLDELEILYAWLPNVHERLLVSSDIYSPFAV